MINILIIEDEIKVIEAIKAYLEYEGFNVYHALLGSVALKILNENNIDIIILDLMLPDISGEEICKKIRTESNIPIIMLTAKSSEESKVYGFNIGADDYLVKPFSPRELVARVKSLLRRSKNSKIENIVEFKNGLTIDYTHNLVSKNNINIILTPNEYKLLSFLSKNQGRYFSREQLIEYALRNQFEGYDRSIDSHIKNLRQKIEDNNKTPKFIITQYGFGYKFDG